MYRVTLWLERHEKSDELLTLWQAAKDDKQARKRALNRAMRKLAKEPRAAIFTYGARIVRVEPISTVCADALEMLAAF